jgi:hypothetical protein
MDDIVADGIFIARDRLVSEVVGRAVNAKHDSWKVQAATSRANCSLPDLSPLKRKSINVWAERRQGVGKLDALCVR